MAIAQGWPHGAAPSANAPVSGVDARFRAPLHPTLKTLHERC